MFKISTLLLLLICLTSAANAADLHFMYGINQSFFRSTDASYPSYSPSMGMAFGALVYGDLNSTLKDWSNDRLKYRSGAYFAQRVTTITVGNTNAHFNVGYIDLPLTLLYRFSDRYGFFAGAIPKIKTSSDCTGYMSICDPDYVAAANLQAFGAQAGFNFQLGGIWSAELFYDWGITNITSFGHADAVTGTIVVKY